jgi:ferredoxin--NADP+ reductase
VDGPEFDGHQVNFDLLAKRLNMYKGQELVAFEEYKTRGQVTGEA